GVDAESPYAEAIEDAPSLRPVPAGSASLGDSADAVVVTVVRPGSGDDGSIDAADVDEVVVRASDTQKGEAAAASVREAVASHNERLMRAEPNQTAAFPVVVMLRYVGRTTGVDDGATLGGSNEGSDGGSTDGSDAGTGGGDDGSDGGDGTSGGEGGDSTGDAGSVGSGADSDDDGGFAVPSIGGAAFGANTVGSPGSLTPPFPFTSLLLAFVFLVPMNFLIQAYGSSILDERTNRRGEPLLVTPLSPAEIVAGKTLPYAAAAA
ncbi:PrsW family intramembrane metalloprotease, partial [Halorubrum distributum]